MEVETRKFERVHTPAVFIIYAITATGVNDIITTGYGEVVHFNGSSWFLYPEVKAIGDGFVYWYRVKAKNDFVIVGGGWYAIYNTVPIILRGYR
jgi:hypothetical protein